MNGLGRIFDLVSGILPLDLQTARTGDAVSLKDWKHVTMVLFKGPGTDGDDQTLTFEQGTAAAMSTKKGINVAEYWKKEAATNLESTGTWTRVTQTAASTVALPDPSAQDAAMYVFEFDADDLDADGGYDYIRVSSDGNGSNAQLGCAFYILSEPRYASAPVNLPSAIA